MAGCCGCLRGLTAAAAGGKAAELIRQCGAALRRLQAGGGEFTAPRQCAAAAALCEVGVNRPCPEQDALLSIRQERFARAHQPASQQIKQTKSCTVLATCRLRCPALMAYLPGIQQK